MSLTIFKGRGATINPDGRFEQARRALEDDGWGGLDALSQDPAPRTEIFRDTSRSVIARNDSPDIPFDQSINPYRGCEHGCIYCYARPSHSYLGLSPGLDFETKLFAKHDAASLLRAELARPGYVAKVIALGANTDPYQPIEKRLGITRSILEVLLEARHPLGIVTKSALVLRDVDLLAELARLSLVRVFVSVTTLDPVLARVMEPRASAPHRRLMAVEQLAAAGVPVGVMVAPIIPAINDAEIEHIVARVAAAGAVGVSHTLVRLPHELKDLFGAWLEEHFPDRAERVLSLIRQTRGGRLYDADFGTRMRGTGPIADLIRDRVRRAAMRHGLAGRRYPQRTDLFRAPRRDGQMDLFGAASETV
jgi:DNA repair photolyase